MHLGRATAEHVTNAGRRSTRLAVAAIVAVTLLASLVFAVGHAATATAATAAVGGGRAGFAPGSMILWESDADVARDLDAMVAAGGTWVRFDFDWPSIQPTPASFNWANPDRLVTAATARGLKVLALPTYTPAWARPAGTSDKTPPTNPADFAAFVRAAVQRYGSSVHHWEIWNEPNLAQFWSPAPNAAAYTTLLKAAHDAIKSVDPTAAVLFGGLSPATDQATQISPVTYVTQAYAAGARGAFDAMALHPYSFPAMPMEPGTEGWNSFIRMSLVHDLMVSNGDGAKQIWATEFGAPTGTSSAAVSESKQAAIATEALGAMGQWSWAGPLFWYSHRDAGVDPTDREANFGLVRFDRTPKLALAAFTSAAASAPAPAPIVIGGPVAPTTTTTTVAPTTTTVATTTVAPTTTSTIAPRVKRPRRSTTYTWRTS